MAQLGPDEMKITYTTTALHRLEGLGLQRQGRLRPYYVMQFMREQSRCIIEEK